MILPGDTKSKTTLDGILTGVRHMNLKEKFQKLSDEAKETPRVFEPCHGNLVDGICFRGEQVCQRQSGMVCTVWGTEKIQAWSRLGICPTNTLTTTSDKQQPTKKVNPIKASKRMRKGN